MRHFADRRKGLFILWIFAVIVGTSPRHAIGGAAADPPLSDSLYTAHHPRLLFGSGDRFYYFFKVRNGGDDDVAYQILRDAAESVYPGYTMEELLDDDYGLTSIPNLGLAGHLGFRADPDAIVLGREVTLCIADSFAANNREFETALRLRSLALGYDMFFEDSSESEREYIRDEITSYLNVILNRDLYRYWWYRPFLGNKSAMLAASVGLAAICLSGETDPARIEAAFDYVDVTLDALLEYQLDENGAYNEGLVYGSWTMRMLIYYFHARKRFDGVDFSQHPRIRNMEKWFAYELLPEGAGRTNNLNDCAYKDYILSRHHTYFDWAQSQWGSNLSSWLWEHTAGDNGHDFGLEADQTATVLWNGTVPPVSPEGVLPHSQLWEQRGLYYYRSGWEMGPDSKDVLFSFYSGEFQGAHAQEDQGQFTLYGYGVGFAVDNGPGSIAKQSNAHNIVLIDGKGQHNAGSSIGTDGAITEHLLSDYADYLVGDLTNAYTTYSKWNRRNIPIQGADWSWGYDGGNPVEFAYRKVVVVHGDPLPPYFIIVDDIQKDGLARRYDWRMHTRDANTVDESTNPIVITNGNSRLDIHVVEPPFASIQTAVSPWVNDGDEPDASVISLSVVDTSPEFAVILMPGDAGVSVPSVAKISYPWGYSVTMDWGAGAIDVMTRNTSGVAVTFSVDAVTPAMQFEKIADGGNHSPASVTMTTDASLSLVRLQGDALVDYLLADASEFDYQETQYVRVTNGTLNCGMSGGVIRVDRPDADFTFYAPGVGDVFYRDQRIYAVSNGDYLTRDFTTGVEESSRPQYAIEATAYPNPFNPATVVRVELQRRTDVEATIYDVNGKRVKRLWTGVLPQGTTELGWDGGDEKGTHVASGVYFLRIQSRDNSKILKLVVLK